MLLLYLCMDKVSRKRCKEKRKGLSVLRNDHYFLFFCTSIWSILYIKAFLWNDGYTWQRLRRNGAVSEGWSHYQTQSTNAMITSLKKLKPPSKLPLPEVNQQNRNCNGNKNEKLKNWEMKTKLHNKEPQERKRKRKRKDRRLCHLISINSRYFAKNEGVEIASFL